MAEEQSTQRQGLVGQRVGRYELLEELGRGGMGIVYRAHDTGLDRIVAIKTITAQHAEDEYFVRRLWTEAKAMAKLESTYIVNVYNIEETPYGLFIVMEYVEGEDLSSRLKREGPMPWHAALPIIRQTLQGFRFAHERGVLHRDVKPSNVMIMPGGGVKIMDFGLAKVQQAGESTMTSGTGGTLYYMAPEQVRGLALVDARSDLYSWGMSCYELLSGSVPFDKTAGQFTIMQAIISGDFPEPLDFSKVPERLAAILLKAIATDPDHRYQSADDWLADLDGVEGVPQTNQLAAAAPPVAAPVPVSTPAPIATEMPPAASASAPAAETEAAPGTPRKRSLALPLVLVAIGVVLALIAGVFLFRDRLPWLAPADPPGWSLDTRPSGAALFADGRPLGTTPLTLPDIPGETVHLRFERDGYLPLDTTLHLAETSGALPPFALEPAGRLRLNVEPAEATVLLDGEPVPLDSAITLAVGSHRLAISHDGYEPVEEVVEIAQDETLAPRYTLNAVPEETSDPVAERRLPPDRTTPAETTTSPGTLEIIARPYADIYIDGRRHREGFDRLYRVQLPPGRHVIRLVHPALGTREETVDLRSGETLTIDRNFVNQ